MEVEEPQATAQHDAPAPAPEDMLSFPIHGTEIFFGRLPRSFTDDELKTFAEQAGPVHSAQVKTDPSQPDQNRGFGFVRYTDRESAVKALDQLPDNEIQGHPDHRVRVQPSTSKNKLHIAGLPHSLTQEALQSSLEIALPGVQHVDLIMNKDNPSQNRGFCFIEFYNTECAKAGKTAISTGTVAIEGVPSPQDLSIHLTESNQRDKLRYPSKNVFVGNLPDDTKEEDLQEVFGKYGEVERISFPQVKQNFAFVNFKNCLSAFLAVEGSSGDGQKAKLGDVELTVNYGKLPQSSQQQQGQQQFGQQQFGYQQGQYYGGGYQQQQQYGGGGGGGRGGYGGGGGGGYGMQGMLPVVPVQLANGQVAYMVQQPGGGGGYGGGRGRGRGGGGYNRWQPY